MSERLERIMTSVLTLAVVVIAIAVVRREFFGGAAGVRTAEYVEPWESIRSEGVPLGGQEAPLQIVVFSDIQCPYCKAFHERVRRLEAAHPDKLNMVFVHYPLPNHAQARPAARAAECADRQGRFGNYLDALFSVQDSLGVIPYREVAARAGIADTASFEACLADSAPVVRIDRGVALGDSMKLLGTPTVILNGWRMAGMPSDSLILASMEKAASGKRLRFD